MTSRRRRPLVTVVLPTFGRPEYLRIALGSVLSQTFDDFEVLVRDNAGEPPADAVVREFNDPRVKLKRHRENLGAPRNAIDGLASASGKYVALLADDDAWLPELLTVLVGHLEADPTLVLAFADHELMDATGQRLPEATQILRSDFKRDRLRAGRHESLVELTLLDRSASLATASLIRRSAMPDMANALDGGFAYDIWLGYQLAASGGAAYYEPRPLAFYRHHGGMNTLVADLDPGYVATYRAAASDPRLSSHHHELRRRLGEHSVSHGIALLRAGHRSKARPVLASGLRHAPSLRALVASCLARLPAGSSMARKLRTGRRR